MEKKAPNLLKILDTDRLIKRKQYKLYAKCLFIIAFISSSKTINAHNSINSTSTQIIFNASIKEHLNNSLILQTDSHYNRIEFIDKFLIWE